ncbi:FAD-binding protein, partial [Roseisolibacter sp. H3M3-2]|uniref:FAD-binding protein n=1 Tax=Roseisolibacter sp. H3M3-2 TaxID=3031323 RepID=UPI0023DAEC3C
FVFLRPLGLRLEAASRGTRLRLVGAGTWLDAGRPVAAGAALALAALRGIVDYVPGDLTRTARAGTPANEIARAAAAERQFLALDPFGDAAGTLGATVATASAGPLAHAFGTPRDNVLGLAFAIGPRVVVRAGGRRLKNVAGFDLVRLLTGAWGTLGAITEVSVRLRALPDDDATVAAALPPARALDAWGARLLGAPLA